MKVIKILAAVWFAIILIGVPTAYLLSDSPTSATRITSPSTSPSTSAKPDTDEGGGVSAPSIAYDCSYHDGREYYYNGCYHPYPMPVPPPQPNLNPSGVERFLLLGSTDPHMPGNSTTSFLMAFFALSSVIAGAALALLRKGWILPTGLLAAGAALFVAAQVLWNSAGNIQWLLGFAFLAVNLALLTALGFFVLKSAESRRRLTVGIAALLIVATTMVQAGIFYELIGSPDRYDCCPYSTHGMAESPVAATTPGEVMPDETERPA